MVTIREIAKTVGVSSTTVSRVLNLDPSLSVSDEKRNAIIETAEAMNYATPRARREKQLGSALLVHSRDLNRELNDPYYVGLRLGIENRCKELGLQIMSIHADQIASQKAAIRTFNGVIFLSRPELEDWGWIDQFDRRVVFTEWAPEDARYDWVSADLYKSMTKLLNQLEALDYTRIGYIGQSISENIGLGDEPRYKAYRDWMEARGRFDEAICLTAPLPMTEREQFGFDLTKKILKTNIPPDCIVTFNDNVAVGAYRAIHELGLKIPNEISIASFNNISAAQFLSPPLTTVHIPSEAIGEASVDLLAERFKGRKVAKYVTMATEIIWRGSTREPKS